MITGRAYTRRERASAKKIQGFWRQWNPLNRFKHQGPAANYRDAAMNATELYSLEPICEIPLHYLITVSDERKSIWAFDLRTLVHSMTKGTPTENPYTRDNFLERAKRQIHGRIEWLRKRKYLILHVNTDVVTAEQAWNHRVLDVFLRIESLGYYVNCDWFHKLSLQGHKDFYTTMFSLWEWKLHLSQEEKDRIVPTAGTELFRFHPNDMPHKSFSWWQKTNLTLIDTFISKGCSKEDKKMGAMYVLMALVKVSSEAADGLEWLT